MYSFSLTSGVPIAYDTKRDQLIRITETGGFKDLGNVVSSHEQKEPNLMPTPAVNSLDRILVVGASGCGKTTWIGNWLDVYMKFKPKVPVFVFSDCEPETLKPLHRFNPRFVKLDQKIVDKPIQTSELANSIVIFDDIDSISDKNIKNAVKVLASACFKKGSTKNNITCIFTYHAINSGLETKDALLNSNKVVFFTTSTMGIPYALAKLGFTKKQIEELIRLPSRYVCIHKDAPQYVVHERGVFIPQI